MDWTQMRTGYHYPVDATNQTPSSRIKAPGPGSCPPAPTCETPTLLRNSDLPIPGPGRSERLLPEPPDRPAGWARGPRGFKIFH
jgi:hypothetical protein